VSLYYRFFLASRSAICYELLSRAVNLKPLVCSLGAGLCLVTYSALPQSAPFAATQLARPITATTAVLGGMATPNGLDSSSWFEWGEGSSFTNVTSASNVGNGAAVVRVTASISSLSFGANYHYRLVVSNTAGVTYGPERIFTTGNKAGCWGENDSGQSVPARGVTNLVAVGGGDYGSLGVRNDGTVISWGDLPNQQPGDISSLTNVIAVALGWIHEAALKSDGTVTVWGAAGVTRNVPADLTNAIAIAAGLSHTLALRSDGTVEAWGDNSSGQTNVPPDLSNVVAIGAGIWESLALKNDGTIVAWGVITNVPAALTNIVAIAGGGYQGIAIRSDGSVVQWSYGAAQLDPIPPISNVVDVAGGDYHGLALGKDGTVVCWEAFSGGTLQGQTNQPPGIMNGGAIASGRFHSIIVSPNVPPRAFSQSVSGPANRDLTITLGVFDPNNDALTLSISSLPASGSLFQYANGARGAPITSVGTIITDATNRVIFVPATNGFGNPYDTFSFKASDGVADSPLAQVTVQIIGKAYAWTAPATSIRATSAQLNGVATLQGLPTIAWFDWGTSRAYGPSTTPIDLGAGWGISRVNSLLTNLALAGSYHFRLVTSNSAGITYGAEQLFTTGRNVTDFLSTVPPGISNVVGVASGYDHNVALRNDGTAIAWGGNANGQGNVPANATNLVQIVAGNAFSLALNANGQIFGWGLAANGQRQYPSAAGFVAVAAGAYHGLALGSNGIVTGWGAVGSGLNVGQVTPPSGLSNVVAISAGVYHSLALKSDGTVVAWGNGYYGQTSVPSNLSNVVAIAAGSYHSTALQADGTMVTWGEWDFQNIALPAGLSNVVAIGAGYAFNIALTSDGVVGAAGNYPSSISVHAGLTNAVAINVGANAGDALAVGNVPPRITPLAFSGPANRDILMSLASSVSDANGDPIALRVATLPAFGTLYQYDNGSRGALITGPDMPVTDSLGRLFFAPALNGFGAPYDSFAYNGNDGWVDSSPATVTVTIRATDYAATQAPTSVGPTNATLNGAAIAGGIPGTAWFQWGTDSNFGQSTAPIDIGNGTNLTRVSAVLNGLEIGGIYHVRLVVSNAAGVVYGGEQLFTTASALRAWGYNSFGQATAPALSNAVAVACGSEHNLALLNDGAVIAWGRNDDGQATVPDGLSNVVAIAAGDRFSLALQNDGTIVGWGTNSNGQLSVPPSLTNAIAIAAGSAHVVALRSDGTVTAWGLNTSGQTNVPAGLANVVAIAAGSAHSLALKGDGTVVLWGTQSVPVGLTNVVAIAASGKHSLARKLDGSVTAWGTSTVYGETVVPSGLTNIIAIACGTNHNNAIRRDGSLAFWGRNDFGQSSPVPGLSNVVAFASGLLHNLALAPNVPLTFASTLPPTAVRAISANLNGMATPGGLPSVAWFQWGTNANYGQTTGATDVGSGGGVVFVATNISGLLPYSIYHCRLAVSNASGIVYGRDQTFTTGGRVTAFGSNSGGQTNVPGTLHDVVAFSAGDAHSIALQNDGRVVAWGTNLNGKTTIPALASNVVAIGAGANHNLVLRSDGTVGAWGLGSLGQTNVPAGLSNVIAIAGGGWHSLALRSDGTVAAWGAFGGFGGPPQGSQAIVPAGLSNVVAIAAGAYYSLALKNDGTLVFWGSNAPPPGLSNGGAVAPAPNVAGLTTIAAGGGHSLGLKANGAVVAWGDNYFGQTNLPTSLINAMAVSAGLYHSAALKTNGTVVTWGYAGGASITPPANLTNAIAIASGLNHILALTVSPSLPQVITLAPTAQRATSVVLNGTTLRNAASASAWFEWGTNGTFTQTTVATLLTNSAPFNRLTATISGLAAGGIYSAHLVVSNAAGTGRGNEQRFTTGQRVISWGDYSNPLSFPPPVLTNVVAISGANAFSLAVRNDGSVLAWGTNAFGEIGVPPELSNVASAAGGVGHCVALRTDGTVTAWGQNTHGQTNVPPGLSNVVAVSAGQSHSLALRSDGTAVSWGTDVDIETNVPPSLGYAAAISAGWAHSLALRPDGSVFAWGGDHNGQTDVPAGLTNVIAIAAGAYHNLALKSNGTVVAWGSNSSGATTVPTGLTNVIAIAAGELQSLALKKDGTLVAWGNGFLTGVNFPTAAGNVVAISCGRYSTLALAPNRKPVGQPSTTVGAANHQMVLTFTATDDDPDQLSLRIASLPAQGLLYQNAGGARGAQITAPNVPITDVVKNPGYAVANLLFVPAANWYSPPEPSFSVIANDGYADSSPAAISVNISPPVVPAITSSGPATNGTYQLIVTGDSNTTYCVWASTNLVTWDFLGQATQTLPGKFLFLDTAAANFPKRFYRLSTGCLAPAPQFTGYTRSDAGFELDFSGATDSAYRVWASTNMADWQELGLATEISPGFFRFTDTASAAYPQRFYRAGTP
jgi:alpha-tubulin suppressor-like RCC1 family protein